MASKLLHFIVGCLAQSLSEKSASESLITNMVQLFVQGGEKKTGCLVFKVGGLNEMTTLRRFKAWRGK